MKYVGNCLNFQKWEHILFSETLQMFILEAWYNLNIKERKIPKMSFVFPWLTELLLMKL